MTRADCRRFYAQEIKLIAHLASPALVEAFARVPREMLLICLLMKNIGWRQDIMPRSPTPATRY